MVDTNEPVPSTLILFYGSNLEDEDVLRLEDSLTEQAGQPVVVLDGKFDGKIVELSGSKRLLISLRVSLSDSERQDLSVELSERIGRSVVVIDNSFVGSPIQF